MPRGAVEMAPPRSTTRKHEESTMIRCYAFAWVPPFARGQVRDLRVRWALEELELPYESVLVGNAPGALPGDAYRAVHPFGQVPALEDGELVLFESGAIVLYLAERYPPQLLA